MKVTTYKYEKVAVSDTELFIPQKPFYCFQTGIRRSIRITPKIVTWDVKSVNSPHKKGEVYSLNITCVYGSFQCKIEKFNIQISQIDGLINRSDKSNESSIIEMLLSEDYNTREEAQFNADLEGAIYNINNDESN